MDRIDEQILDMLEKNARMSYQELGNTLGMSRVAAKKRVTKLEEAGIIRGYHTCILRDDEITVFIDIVTKPGKYEDVLTYVSIETLFIRQIFRTTKKDHIHIVAVSNSVQDLKNLTNMIDEACGDDIAELHCHAVKEIVKDLYGGIGNERRTRQDSEGDNEDSWS